MKSSITQATAIPAGASLNSDTTVTHTMLGWNHIHWGLSLFFTGFVTGYVPLVHYVKGAVAGDVGPRLSQEHDPVVGLSRCSGGDDAQVRRSRYDCHRIMLPGASPAKRIVNYFQDGTNRSQALCLRACRRTRNGRSGICCLQYFLAKLLFRTCPGRKKCVAVSTNCQHHHFRSWPLLCVQWNQTRIPPACINKLRRPGEFEEVK